MSTEKREPILTMIDGRDALAYVLIKPNGDEGIVVDAAADGLSKKQAAYVLRRVADQWDPQPVVTRDDVRDAARKLGGQTSVLNS